MKIKSYAKINLTLNVLEKRKDGYHNIESIMQTINLFDEIKLEEGKSGIKIITNCKEIPIDENNIAFKSAKIFMEESKINKNLLIKIKKNIPVSSGLGGGSSNAAAIILGLNKFLNTNFQLSKLKKIAIKIGSDVPFFLTGGTAFVYGKGEKIITQPSIPEMFFLLVKPNFSISTSFAYKNLKLNSIKIRPNKKAMINAIKQKNLLRISSNLTNVFEEIIIPIYPEILKIKERLKKLGALNSLMSGSGSIVFGIFAKKEDAEKAKNKFLEKTFLVNPHQKGVEIYD